MKDFKKFSLLKDEPTVATDNTMSNEKETITRKCTLTDDELINKLHWWVKKLAETGGEAWTLRVPVDFNNDPDVLICEIVDRYKLVSDYRASLRKKIAERMKLLKLRFRRRLG
jgi:hypothetical protein